MRRVKLWQKVGPPTWKRSGTVAFAAVIGVLLVGGTAMAANFGLLHRSSSPERGYRLNTPPTALSVSVPPAGPAAPTDGSLPDPDGDRSSKSTDSVNGDEVDPMDSTTTTAGQTLDPSHGVDDDGDPDDGEDHSSDSERHHEDNDREGDVDDDHGDDGDVDDDADDDEDEDEDEDRRGGADGGQDDD